MHTNYYFLRQLAPALEAHLTGLKLMECFSQDRDELVLTFAQAKGKVNYYRPFYIKATLRPDFSGLLFPEQVHRARTNSVNLLEELYERPVEYVHSFLNERCLGIGLEGGITLLFKFFGNRPNLVTFQGETVIDLFNTKLAEDNALKLPQIDRLIDQSWEAFAAAGDDHRKLFPTFGKEVNAWLNEKGIAEMSGQEKWALIQETLHLLTHPRYYLTTFEHKPALTLVPLGDVRQEFDNPVEAANQFYAAFMGRNNLERERGELLRLLEKRLKRTQAYIDTNFERLMNHDESTRYEELANILMANLHQTPEQSDRRATDRVELYDFYRDKPIVIKLKPELSLQKNAETYYRKARNEKIEIDNIQQGIGRREHEAEALRRHIAAIQEIDSLRELRKYVKTNGLNLEKATPTPVELFKQVIVEGFTILIGRNAKNNDRLTQQYSFKEDLWLHARGVPGSHVLIKYQPGKNYPKTVIERAAQLAAWYSRRRTDSLCPVIVTPKKFVRKPKGLAEGQVVVDKENVVLVEPKGE